MLNIALKFEVIWMFNNERHLGLIQFPSKPIDNDIIHDVILIVLLWLRCYNFFMFIKTYYFHPFTV